MPKSSSIKIKPFPLKFYRFKTLDSTNAAAFRYAKRGIPTPSVFVADYQTKGRGKWGRQWVSPRGKNLLFSILLRPTVRASRAPYVTQVVCRSVARVLAGKFHLATTFKRPNDILVQGRKICGVLVEAQSRADGEVEHLVVGVGLNVNARLQELVPGATSLLEVTRRRQPRFPLLRALVSEILADLTQVLKDTASSHATFGR